MAKTSTQPVSQVSDEKLSGDELQHATLLALGFNINVVDSVSFNPRTDPAKIPNLMEYLNKSRNIQQMGGQATLFWSSAFDAYVVTWTFRGDMYESMRQGKTINEALCRAVVAVSKYAIPTNPKNAAT